VSRRDGPPGGDEAGGLGALIAGLSRPAAYPHPADPVEVVQTHISVVFLAGDRAYKVKKPVDLGFLDFTTLDKRRAVCEAEVRLNRRLAPAVYLGVEPVTRAEDGGLRLGGDGEPVEWAVAMVRLPADRTFEALLGRGELEAELLAEVGRRLAAFHAGAAAGPEIDRWGRFEVVAGNARENFEQTERFTGATVSEPVWRRLAELTGRELEARRGLIEERAAGGVTRDTHGDLHLDHVYSLPGREPPDDLPIVDCIEFNERFRYADPVSDAAFLVMDLAFHGRDDLAEAFTGAYFAASGDEPGRSLMPHYTAYRAVTRGKVESMTLAADEVPAGQRWRELQRARAHFLLALRLLTPPAGRPCLALAAGPPASGKSRLAEGLAGAAGFTVLASDAVRKELAGIDPYESARAPVDRGIYTAEWTERTYAVCRERAERHLFEGGRVVVDATFWREDERRSFLDAARAWCVPARVFLCEVTDEEARRRLAARRGGLSDAYWEVYQAVAGRFEPPGAETEKRVTRLDTAGPPEATLEAALAALRADGLL
jgi:aminoglycoside phosphotransferase family enzyme/predicted kinase